MKLVIVTDAWHPQINGVVTTMSRVVERAKELDRNACRRHATGFTWARAADILLDNLAPINPPLRSHPPSGSHEATCCPDARVHPYSVPGR